MSSLECFNYQFRVFSSEGGILKFLGKYDGDFNENLKQIWEDLMNIPLNIRLLRRDASSFTLSTKEQLCFDQLATIYNQADGEKLEKWCNDLERQRDPDQTCLAMYFKANFALLKRELEKAERFLGEALKLSTSTSKPEFFRILISSPLARLSYMKNSLPELENILRECFCEISLQCKACSGSFSGWIFYMKAMWHYARSHDLTIEKVEDLIEYKNEIDKAIHDMRCALDQFNVATTEDKHFGKAHALSRLVMFHLHCGQDASLLHYYTVLPSEINEANKYRKDLQKCRKIVHNVVIELLHAMAESDYHFRVSEFKQAAEKAEHAFKLATEHECHEFIKCTRKRKEVFTEMARKGDAEIIDVTSTTINNVGNIYINGPVQIGDNNKQNVIH